jgi:hypothetical protein
MLYFDAAPVATSNPFSVSGEPFPSRNREMLGDTRDRGRMRRPALEHDPEKWVPVFRKRSCSNKKIERDDDFEEKSSRSGASEQNVRLAAPCD